MDDDRHPESDISQRCTNSIVTVSSKLPIGQRDYAILLLLARLGLRAGEIVGLTLDDIDWQAGSILITGKLGNSTVLPLPADVGEAISSYLLNGRPRAFNQASRRIAPHTRGSSI